MEESSREQMAAEDPFGGSGEFIAYPGLSAGEIDDALTEKGLGHAHSFVWGGIGAWVEVDRAGGS